MTMSPEMLGAGQAVTRQERYSNSLSAAYGGRGGGEDGEPRNGTVALDPAGDKPRLPSLDLAVPPEPVFTPESWLDPSTGNLADHPLLRGLLLELPPKGSTPPPGWLDRWFEATRSILELLYVNDRN